MGGKPDYGRRERARELRRSGHSLSQIAEIMGLKSTGGVLGRWLRGVPPAEWTRRPRAKDHLREEAVRLRREGRSYSEIEGVLGVSKSSLSVWLRDMPLTEEHRAALAEKQRSSVRRRADSIRAARRAREARMIEEAAAQIGRLDERDLFIAGVVAYWAEGTKTKPWGSRALVKFVNSDAAMIQLFLRWLDLVGVTSGERTYRLLIHESADVEAAAEYWSELVAVPLDAMRVTLKRHNPRTVRKNVGLSYVGCLEVRVRGSTDLNTRIAGWFRGLEARVPRVPTKGPRRTDTGNGRG